MCVGKHSLGPLLQQLLDTCPKVRWRYWSGKRVGMPLAASERQSGEFEVTACERPSYMIKPYDRVRLPSRSRL